MVRESTVHRAMASSATSVSAGTSIDCVFVITLALMPARYSVDVKEGEGGHGLL
jgi:hypothetical protein